MLTRYHAFAAPFVIVVAAVLLGLAVRPASAGSATAYVDGDANRACASLVPCYTTIQAAVNNVSGPGDAQVLVFPGTYNESVNLANMGSASTRTIGNISLRTTDAAGSPAFSTATIHGATPITTGAQPFPKGATIDGFILQATQGDGAFIHTSGAIKISHVTADNPGDGAGGDGDDGLDLATTGGGLVTVDQSEANGAHGQLGDGIQIVTTGGATISDTQASNNRGTQDNVGINIPDSKGDIVLQNVAADSNSEQGVYIYTTGTISVGGRANSNGFRGVDLFTELGFQSHSAQPQASSPAITIGGLQLLGNADDGADAQSGGNILVRDSLATGNAVRGFQLLTSGSVDVTNTRAGSNKGDGIYIEAKQNATMRGVTAINNGAEGDKPGLHIVGFGAELASVSVENSLVMQNHGNGIDLFNLSASGTHDVTSNVICGNVKGGLRNNGTILTLPAQANWWGDSTGPKSNGNPGGTGDAVNLGGDGTISFNPWISEVSPLAELARANATSKIQFQFTDADRHLFLNSGPGDELNLSPFTLTADNGTVAPTSTGYIDSNALLYNVTPDHTGNDVLTLTGPCGLDSHVTLAVGAGFPRGDLNCDGTVDLQDVTRSLRFTAGLALTDIAGCGVALPEYDLDCRGSADGLDPMLLLLKIAGVQPTFSLPPTCPPIG